MTKRDKKIVALSSKKEQEIEKAYLDSKMGKLLYYVTIVGIIVLLAGLLVALYETLTLKANFYIQNSNAKNLLLWGGVICTLSLLFYIKFSSDFNNKQTKKVATKPATKTVTKTKAVAKTAAKPATKTTKETKTVKKTTTTKKK